MKEKRKSSVVIENDYPLQTRKTPFKEGVYVLKNPLFLCFNPRLILRFNKKGNKIKGELKWLRKKKKLSLIKLREEQVVFQFNVDIIAVDIVLNFYKEEAFEGFFDTPIGHIRFTGYCLGQSLGGMR